MSDEDRILVELSLLAPLRADMLNGLQQVLQHLAPTWSQRVSAGAEEGMKVVPIDLLSPGSVIEAVQAERERLIGRGFHTGGAAEWLKGLTDEFEIEVEVNDSLMKRGGSAFANRVAVIVHKPVIESRPAPEWLWTFVASLSELLPVAYGFGRTFGEFAATNKMGRSLREAPLGIDIAKHLPGLYWLNVFGQPYVELIGAARLATAPASRILESGGALLLTLDAKPWAWRSAEYAQRRKDCLSHIGRDIFYDRHAPNRISRVPALFAKPATLTPRPN